MYKVISINPIISSMHKQNDKKISNKKKEEKISTIVENCHE